MSERSAPAKILAGGHKKKRHILVHLLNLALLLTAFASICFVPSFLTYPPAKVFLFLYCLLILLVNLQIGCLYKGIEQFPD